MEVEQVDVVVVGTGWNGLICGKTYLDFEPHAKLLFLDDGESIGGVWSTENIYPTLYAQIKYGQFEYSFYPMRREGVTADGYISGKTVQTYLNDFADAYGLARRTRLRTRVDTVTRVPGRGWRLSTSGASSGVIECAKLIYASGATSHPVVPKWPTSPGFTAPVIHSKDTGKHLDELLAMKRVTVVGAAKSAYDSVFLLLNAGVKVDWVIRDDGSGPLAIMPPTIFGLANTMDCVATRIIATLGACIMSTDSMGYYLFHRTMVGSSLRWGFWRALNALAAHHVGYSRDANTAKLRPLPFGNGIFWAYSGLGAASVPDYWKVFHAGDCTVHRTEFLELRDGNSIQLRNGDEIKTDGVLLCTGFDKSYQPFSQELQYQCDIAPDPRTSEHWAVLESEAEKTVNALFPVLRHPPVPVPIAHAKAAAAPKDKQPKLAHGPSRHYRRLISPTLTAEGDRSVIFPGFIHSIYTPLVSESQALWGVTYMLGLNEPPSQSIMEKEVATWNVWSRKRYPVQGWKHAYAIYDFLPYIDTLLRDLGINTRRKLNPFTHLFKPAYPSHYRGLLGEFRQAYDKKRVGQTQVSETHVAFLIMSWTVDIVCFSLLIALAMRAWA